MRNLSSTIIRCTATIIVVLALLIMPASARADTYTVDSTDDLADADPGDHVCATAPPNPLCTLRAAVMEADAQSGTTNTIDIPAGTYVLKSDLEITSPLIIEGISDPVVIDANGAATMDRAFEVIDTSLSLAHVTIKNGNAASYGGAIYAHGGSSLLLSYVALLDNSAALDGGAVYAIDLDVIFENGIVQGNAALGNGGGIALAGQAKNPTLILGGVEIAGNQAGSGASGGGVNAQNGSVEFDTCFVHDNSAGNGGGGAQFVASLPASLLINDSIFDHNTAGSVGGGALLVSGRETIARSRFSNNSASYGGAIVGSEGPHQWTDIAISANDATSGGGGAEMISGDVTVLRASIDGNTAAFEGGGLFMAGGSLHLTDSVIFDNTAANGGGAWISVTLVAASSAIYGNHASIDGGGLYDGAYSDGDTPLVELDGSILDHNRAGTNGGGLYVDATGVARLYNATITANAARQNYPAAGSGGGIYVVSPAAVTAFGSVLAYNIDSALIAAANDCSGTLTAAGYDFVGASNGCTIVVGGSGNQIGGGTKIDPQLSAFERLYDPAPASPPAASAKFGRVPLAGSPLIDAGPPPGSCIDAEGNPLLRDEIGQDRQLGGRCDIGAVEFGAALDEIFLGTFEP